VGDTEDSERLMARKRPRPDAGQLLLAAVLAAAGVVAVIAVFGR
jgi:hypothetical protein